MKKIANNRADIRDETVTFPVTADEKKAIQKSADNKGLTMSALCRMVIKDYLKNN